MYDYEAKDATELVMTKNETSNPKADKPVFYVYIHYRNDTGQPFYVGRGTQVEWGQQDKTFYARAHSWDGRTKRWERIAKKHGYTIAILVDDLTLAEAKVKEREFIKLYGRVKYGGLLVNYKNGGEDDVTDYKHSKETIEKFTASKRKPLQYYIDKYVAYEPNTGCWVWTGQFSDGHPKVNFQGRTIQAVRAIYQELNQVTLKPKTEVLHNTCGCEYCVNPQHFVIDHACTKEQQTRKLTEGEVVEIKKIAFTTTLTQTEIGNMFNVTDSAINGILTGRSWKWVQVDGIPETIAINYFDRPTKEIICLETGEIFKSAREAAIKLFNTPNPLKNIRRCCVNPNWGYKGFHFRFTNNG